MLDLERECQVREVDNHHGQCSSLIHPLMQLLVCTTLVTTGNGPTRYPRKLLNSCCSSSSVGVVRATNSLLEIGHRATAPRRGIFQLAEQPSHLWKGVDGLTFQTRRAPQQSHDLVARSGLDTGWVKVSLTRLFVDQTHCAHRFLRN